MEKIKSILLLVLLFTFITSCMPAVSNAEGLYEYEYCIGKSGQTSQIKQVHTSAASSSGLKITGTVTDSYSRSIQGAIILYKLSNSDIERQVYSSDTGSFALNIPAGCYDFTIKMIGYTPATSHMCFESNTELESTLGEGSGFYTYGITSTRKLFRFQLRRRVKQYASID